MPTAARKACALLLVGDVFIWLRWREETTEIASTRLRVGFLKLKLA